MGAEIRVHMAGGGVQVSRIVTGDSFNAQHANARHFGLGASDNVEAIEVVWPDGELTRVENPAADKWHDVRAGGAATAAGR